MNQVMGYRRNNQVGFRNHILVIPSVFCSNKVCEDIAEGIDGVIAIDHAHGCGQIGSDLEQTKRTFIGTSLNPNVYGVIIVGQGCEDAAAEEIADRVKQQSSKPVHVFTIQDLGDTRYATERGRELAYEMVHEVQQLKQEPIDLSELVIGFMPNQIEEQTKQTSARLMQAYAEELLENQGTAVYGDYNEIYPALARLHSLSSETVQQHLTTLEENPDYEISENVKLEDFIAQNHPVTEVISYAETIKNNNGIIYMHGPNHNLEQSTGLIATGVHMILMGTSEGSMLGSPVAPILKISASDELYDIFENDLDLNAGKLAANPEQLSKSEEMGINEFGIQRIGLSI